MSPRAGATSTAVPIGRRAGRWAALGAAALLLTGCDSPAQRACQASENRLELHDGTRWGVATGTVAVALVAALVARRAQGRLRAEHAGLRTIGLLGVVGVIATALASVGALAGSFYADSQIRCDDGGLNINARSPGSVAVLGVLIGVPFALLASLSLFGLRLVPALTDGARSRTPAPVVVGAVLVVIGADAVIRSPNPLSAALAGSALALLAGGVGILRTPPTHLTEPQPAPRRPPRAGSRREALTRRRQPRT